MSQPALSGRDEPERWPFGVSRTPTMSIGSAMSVLHQEFPAVSISKIRFLEDQGIVFPHRTPSGYRTYSQADIERLRFALAAQRDSYLPWAKIRERLEELDRGGAGVPAPGARVVTEDGELTAAVSRSRMTRSQLADAAGTSEEVIGELTDAGLISTDAGHKYPAATIDVVRAAQELAKHGLQPRHLRAVRSAADRQIDMVEAVVAPVRSHRTGPSSAASHARAQALAADLAKSFTQLHSALLEAGIDRLL